MNELRQEESLKECPEYRSGWTRIYGNYCYNEMLSSEHQSACRLAKDIMQND